MNKPTTNELEQHGIRSFRGIDVGLGVADPVATIALKLEEKHPGHLILVQSGNFLHGYDRTAHALAILKSYKMKLVGESSDPHIRVGFPVGNFKRRLWNIVEEFGIPYVVALGTKSTDRTVYVSNQPTGNIHVLDVVTPEIVAQVIEDLKQRGEVNKAAAEMLLATPDSTAFQFKSKTQELDTEITRDLVKMPRDLRTTYGENLRTCMARILRAAMAYGLEGNKPKLLKSISADVDALKHYITQAEKLGQLKLNFEARAVQAVELGRLVGGLIRSTQVRA